MLDVMYLSVTAVDFFFELPIEMMDEWNDNEICGSV